MEVKLANTTKKHNSTEVPTFTKTVTCMLKEGSSIINPTLIFERANIGHTYNYVYIADFGRYYFVNDIVYDGARIFYYCSVDVLATYKSTIGNATAYVLRAAHTYNEYVIDNYYPVTTHIRQNAEFLGTPWLEYGSSRGIWVVGVINEIGVTYYACTRSTFESFMDYMLSPNFVADQLGITVTEAQTNPQWRTMIDPISYITQCVWLPISYSTGSPAAPRFTEESMYIGTAQRSELQAGNISHSTAGRTPVQYTPTPMPHPQSNARGEFLNAPGFTECRLVIPPFGSFELNSMEVNQYDRLQVNVELDCTNGVGKLVVYGYTGTGADEKLVSILLTAQAQVGVPLPITQIITPGLSPVQVGMQALGTVAAAATGNALGAIAGGASMIESYYASKVPKVSTVGSRGTIAGIHGNAYFQYVWKYVADDDNTDHGKPVCDTYQLSTLPGYQMILEPHIHTTGTSAEDDQINSYLASGYFYE